MWSTIRTFLARHSRKIGVIFVAVLIIGTPYAIFLIAQHKKQTESHAATVCTVSPLLADSCRPWLGGEVSGYGSSGSMPQDTKSQVLGHEQRIGRQLDIVHTYHSPGSNSLNASDIYFAKRPNTILEADWVPGGSWATDGSPSFNPSIDKMAASIKSLGSTKIIFSIWHEPENDASGGMSPCTPSGKGHAGTPAQFAAMYRYIHDRMIADGVNNVVWAVNYMGAQNWDKCIDQFWPGNSYVDWIFWDPYAHSGSFDSMVGRFYNVLLAHESSTYDYTSKVWGIAEWNIYWSGMSRQDQIDLYNSARTSIDNNTWPRMKAYEVFDSLDQSVACYPKTNKYQDPPLIDAGVLGAYKNYALSPHFTDAFFGSGGGGGGGDTTAPSISITSPAGGVTVSGTVNVAATASDNVGVTKVTFAVDGNVVTTDTAQPYTAVINSASYSNGNHTIVVTAYDAAGNSKPAQVVVNMSNSTQSGPDTTPPTVTITSPTNNATVSGTITISATATDNVGVAKVVFSIDGNNIGNPVMQPPYTMQLNTALYTNGSHTIKVQGWDAAGNHRTPQVTVTVNNASPVPAPAILSFTAVPPSLTVGSKATLNWTSTNAVSCSVSPDGPQNTTLNSWTTAAYTTTGDQNYTLTCANSTGKTATATTTVHVNPAQAPPAKPTFTADKTSVTSGSDVLLSWSSAGATSCQLTPGNITSSGANGSTLVSAITQTTTYTITCSNTAGTASNTLQIDVSANPSATSPTIVSFTATPNSLSAGQTSTLNWATNNVATNGCALTPSPLTSAAASGLWQTPALTSSVSYTLTCSDTSGKSVSSSLSVTVNGITPPPAPAPSDPTTPPTSSPILKALGGQSIVNAQADGNITKGQLVTLDPGNVLDEKKALAIVRVEYYSGEQLIQTVTDPPYALNTNLLSPGKYTITERTYYDDGSTSERTQDITVNAAATVSHKGPGLSKIMPLIVTLLVLVVGVVAYFVARRIRFIRAQSNIEPSSTFNADEMVISPDPNQSSEAPQPDRVAQLGQLPPLDTPEPGDPDGPDGSGGRGNTPPNTPPQA